MERVGAEVRLGHPRCPFCHAEATPDEPRSGCSACTAWSHDECLREGGDRCAACGATVQALSRATRPRPPSRLPRPPRPRPLVTPSPLVDRLRRRDEAAAWLKDDLPAPELARASGAIGIALLLLAALVALGSLLAPGARVSAAVLAMGAALTLLVAGGVALKHRRERRDG